MAKHCFHYTDQAIFTMPVRYEQKCCQCGAIRHEIHTQVPDPVHHGPWANACTVRIDFEGETGPCTPKPREPFVPEPSQALLDEVRLHKKETT